MKDFTTFREDLASGRPMKKPVTSNLLKNRRKENEKALKSGFMKMPDYVKKKFNEEEEVKPHKMYKGDKVVVAKNKAEHDKLSKQGYTHDDPKTKKIEELNKSTLANYKGKAEKDLKVQRDKYFRPQEDPSRKEARRKAENRIKGMKMADKKMVEEKKNCGCGQDPCITYGKGGKKEMKEQSILEVSDALKTRYIHKAMRDVDNKERAAQLADKQGAPASVGKSLSKSTGKRRQGIAKARANLERPIKEEKQKGVDGKVCWKGYKRMGTKKKGGKTVDNCVKVENFIFDALEKYYEKNLQELSPKTISSYQKKAGKQYRQLRKDTPSRQTADGGYYKGYISDKEYDSINKDRDTMKKRGKGLSMSAGKGVQKEGAFKRKLTDRQEADRLNDKAHAAIGYKKTSDSGIKKVKGGYERKRTYTREPSAYRFPDKDGKATPLYRKEDFRAEQMQLVTNLDLDESIANLVKRGVGKVKDTLQQAGAQYKDHQEKQMKAGKGIYSNPVSGKNIAKRLYGQPQKKR